MRLVDTGELIPGMAAAKPIHSPQGALMFKEGTVLNEKNIWILKSWGVAEVWTEGAAEAHSNSVAQSEGVGNESVAATYNEESSGDLEDQVLAEIMRVAKKQMEKRIHHR